MIEFHRTDKGLVIQVGVIPLFPETTMDPVTLEAAVSAAARRGEISDPVEFGNTVGPKTYGLICTIAGYGFRTLGYPTMEENRAEAERLRRSIQKLRDTPPEVHRRNLRLVKR